MNYYCKECETEVIVSKEGTITRLCDHHEATVIAPRTSILYGEGGSTVTRTLRERAHDALRLLASAFSK